METRRSNAIPRPVSAAGGETAGWPAGAILRTAGGSPHSQRPATGSAWPAAAGAPCGEAAVSSNIAQNYPYSSESDAERLGAVARATEADATLAARIAAESIPVGNEPRWWVWKCPNPGCTGLLHAAGFARNAHAVYAVCDGCAKTLLR